MTSMENYPGVVKQTKDKVLTSVEKYYRRSRLLTQLTATSRLSEKVLQTVKVIDIVKDKGLTSVEKVPADLSDADRISLLSVLRNIASSSSDITKQVTSLFQKVRDGSVHTTKGMSFLEVKYQQLLSYLVNMLHLMCLKTKGSSIVGDASIDRLIEIRTVLERMRPIEHKLRYQIDKVIKTAASSTSDASNDPLHYKPNPEDLVSKLDDDEDQAKEESDGDASDEVKSKLYKPPKLVSTHYDDDLSLQDKAKKSSQKRALSKSIMDDLRKEYFDGPEEVYETFDQHRAKEDKLEKETTEYEEKYFVRMPMSKKQKNASQKVRTLASLDDLVSFDSSKNDQKNSARSKQKLKNKKHFKKGGQKKRRKFH